LAKTIVITGAGVGLGRALARRFASEGETVVLLGRTAAKVEAAAAEIGGAAMAVVCDVSSPDSVRAAFAAIAARHPHIDVLINNAAIFEPFLIAEASDDQIIKAIGTNLTGPMLCARAAIPMMERGAHIINVSSESVELPFPHLLVYQSSKAGLERFSLGLHRELEASGIRVSFVRAGQMMEEGKVWDVDPAAAKRFAMAAMAAGLNLRERPISHFKSVTQVFRSLIDLPPDLHAVSIALHGRTQP
jgi:NAD(P)-dependent dehydrogenase (short-subunit alcohol dehydrogenase family)